MADGNGMSPHACNRLYFPKDEIGETLDMNIGKYILSIIHNCENMHVSLFSTWNMFIFRDKRRNCIQKYHVHENNKQVVKSKFPILQSLLCDCVSMFVYFSPCYAE